MRDHFRELGLVPVPGLEEGDPWYQEVPWEANKAKPGSHVTFQDRRTNDRTQRRRWSVGNRAPTRSKPKGPLTLVVVDDPRDSGIDELDLEGRVVVVAFTDSAMESQIVRRFTVRYAIQALQQGALSAMTISPDGGGELTPSNMAKAGGSGRGKGRGQRPTDLRVSADEFSGVLAAAKVTMAGLANATRHDIEGEVTVHIPVETVQAPAFNVVGMIRGSDPALSAEYVMLGSHLDHLGRRGDTIYPGADDDASGSTGIMAVASMFAHRAKTSPPKRSVVFAAFCGEENGLIGSRYLADNPPLPLENMVAELQMDMIGRNEEHNGEKAEDNPELPAPRRHGEVLPRPARALPSPPTMAPAAQTSIWSTTKRTSSRAATMPASRARASPSRSSSPASIPTTTSRPTPPRRSTTASCCGSRTMSTRLHSTWPAKHRGRCSMQNSGRRTSSGGSPDVPAAPVRKDR